MVFLYTLFYLLFGSIVMHPPQVFTSAGLTVAQLFSSALGGEDEAFVHHHVRRVALLLFVHSLLPLGYALGLLLQLEDEPEYAGYVFYARTLLATAAALPLGVAYKAAEWANSGWRSHPACRRLALYCTEEEPEWVDLAAAINAEFKSVDKISLSINATTKTVVTSNWIVHITPYKLHFAKQNDTIMIVKNSDTHHLSPVSGGEQQFINIEVRSESKKDVKFCIRLNSLDFTELQSKVAKPIVVLPHIVFHKTTIDRFIDVFKDQIALNEKYRTPQELEPCIGCMQTLADVKLFRRCRQDDADPACQNCGCRPMWCADCMARWYATRQDPDHPERWLGEKCTCPLCRQVFCIYDVCYVESTVE